MWGGVGGWGSDFFSQKNIRVSKIGGVVLKKGIWLIFILTNPFQCYLSLSIWCVCMCVLVICTISISIICVSQEKHSLIASNQQIYDWILQVKNVWIEKAFWKVKFWYQWVIFKSFNVIKIAAVSTQQVMYIYTYVCASVYWPLSVLCGCVFTRMEYQIRRPVKNNMCQTLVNLMPHQDPFGTKVPQLDLCRSIL